MRISCLMPTFNRAGRPTFYLVCEALESFLRQDWPDKELIICNDTPGQRLTFAHPQVKVFNLDRLPNLSAKIQFMIDNASGDAFCRWDDDDISLPHRLSYSAAKLGDGLEWRASNYYFDPGHYHEVDGAANSHVMSLWRRETLARIGGQYPPGYSGYEDQAFNRALAAAGISKSGVRIPKADIYYVYRWATGSNHLSGKGGGPADNPHQAHWDELGRKPIAVGEYALTPYWRRNYAYQAQEAARRQVVQAPDAIAGYFDWQPLYDRAVGRAPGGSRLVEVGSYNGASVAYLAAKARAADKRLSVTAVDSGIGLATARQPAYAGLPALLANLRACGVEDCCSVLADESTRAAAVFADNSLEFVFLDAGHDYNSVRADIQAWWPKVRPGGWLGGHDYMGAAHPGVAQAVDEYWALPRWGARSGVAPSCWERRKS